MIYSKIIPALFFSIIISISPLLFSAEQRSTPPQAITSNSSSWLGLWSSGQSSSPISPSAFLFLNSSTPSTSPSTALGYVASCVSGIATNITSAKNTLMNAASDDEAARKLGWPVQDAQAQQELLKTRNAYAQVTSTSNEESRKKFFDLIFRRAAFLQRVYLALPSRPDRTGLAKFCLENHEPAMSPTLKLGFQYFLERNAQEALQATGKEYPAKEINTGNLPMCTEEDEIKSTLLRLGFAISDEETKEAHEILHKCQQLYAIKKTLEKYKNYELSQTDSGRKQLLNGEDSITKHMIQNPSSYDKFINIRTIALRKVDIQFLAKLAGHVSLSVVDHCLKHHTYIMSQFQIGSYRTFIRTQQSMVSKIYAEFGQTSVIDNGTK